MKVRSLLPVIVAGDGSSGVAATLALRVDARQLGETGAGIQFGPFPAATGSAPQAPTWSRGR